MKKTILLAATAALAFACNKRNDADEKRVDEVKAQAKEVKENAEKRADQAKDNIDHQLDRTKAAADRRVDEVKAEAKADERHDVRGVDDNAPDATRWRDRWDRYSKDGTWGNDDDWVVKGKGNDVRVYRRGNEQPASTKMDDDSITTAVKGRFATDDNLRPLKLDVSTDSAVVTLKGDVPSHAVEGEAIRVAVATKGVRQVVSHLNVKH
jgi:hypothetical protein